MTHAKTLYESLTPDEQNTLHALVFDRENNPAHEDDYFNAGGFMAHWADYTDTERIELYNDAKKGTK